MIEHEVQATGKLALKLAELIKLIKQRENNMKAKVKSTGEIIDFLGSSIEYGTCTWIDSGGNFRQGHDMPDIEILERDKSIDWEQRRYELAKAAMQGLLNATSVERFTLRIKPSTIAYVSIEYADALIKELKK